MPTTITAVDVHDVRFPTAAAGDGSDAINRGDYSATYVELRTDAGVTGAGLTFTNGRGNEITCAAVRALAPHVLGRTVEDIFAAPVQFWRRITADVQLRWLGPEKGVIHMAGRRAGQRGVGPACPARRPAAVAPAGRDAGRGTGQLYRLPSHQRRHHATAGAAAAG